MEEGHIVQAIRKAIDLGAARAGGKSALADQIGLHRNRIASWYNGEVDRTDVRVLVRLFEAADMSLDELAGKGTAQTSDPTVTNMLEQVLENTRDIKQAMAGGQFVMTARFEKGGDELAHPLDDADNEDLAEGLTEKIKQNQLSGRGKKHG